MFLFPSPFIITILSIYNSTNILSTSESSHTSVPVVGSVTKPSLFETILAGTDMVEVVFKDLSLKLTDEKIGDITSMISPSFIVPLVSTEHIDVLEIGNASVLLRITAVSIGSEIYFAFVVDSETTVRSKLSNSLTSLHIVRDNFSNSRLRFLGNVVDVSIYIFHQNCIL